MLKDKSGHELSLDTWYLVLNKDAEQLTEKYLFGDFIAKDDYIKISVKENNIYLNLLSPGDGLIENFACGEDIIKKILSLIVIEKSEALGKLFIMIYKREIINKEINKIDKKIQEIIDRMGLESYMRRILE